ncbi:hypothetical protein CLV98_111147 [Dyadobacter jejuensis]|uniref:Lipoprotein n=1 Tax=Dyadobacter jejuensis TaxID=1082580 RepID=A0A316AG16_9BACT|nr:hypothetical protein [Dyadobacter jejuensis]PWJ56653.1 hypothetical protein CLV98_111147 [Dyadobacter jejuensis]
MKGIYLKTMGAILITVMLGCSSPPDTLGGLNLKAWRADRGGCNNERSQLVEAFKGEEEQLKGRFIDDIGALLGRPDIHQLGERNIKLYVYFLESGPQCGDMKVKSNAPKAILKFNAVGLLTEITYQDRPL